MKIARQSVGAGLAGVFLAFSLAAPSSATPAVPQEPTSITVAPLGVVWYTPHSDYFTSEGSCERYGDGFLTRNPYAHWYLFYQNPGQSRWSIDIYLYVEACGWTSLRTATRSPQPAASWSTDPMRGCFPPEPSDLHGSRSRGAATDTAVRLVRRASGPSGPNDTLPPSDAWVRATGVWQEREISATAISTEPMDLSLLDVPQLADEGAPTFGPELATKVGRVFGDRRRRWDLLMVARASGRRAGPVAVVVAVRALPEVASYLSCLADRAVDLRPWLIRSS